MMFHRKFTVLLLYFFNVVATFCTQNGIVLIDILRNPNEPTLDLLISIFQMKNPDSFEDQFLLSRMQRLIGKTNQQQQINH